MPEDQRFDVVIVGSGPAGIFAALELVRAGRSRVAIVEKGHGLEARRCPARQEYCISCPSCDITSGWGGAGAFSDGKLTLTPDVGGWLADFVGREGLEELIAYADGLWVEFGADAGVHGPDPDTEARLVREAVLADMRLVPMRLRHLGTDRAPKVLAGMQDHLAAKGVTVLIDTEVTSILADGGHARGVELADGSRLRSNAVIVGPGRVGSGWLAAEAERLGIGLVNNAVDIGLRVEVPAPVMERLTEPLYEAKLIYHSRAFGDEVRTFCMNPYGEVTTECYGDIVTVNGHSYAEDRTANTNFAVLVSQRFTKPFRDPITYGKSVANLANLLGEGIIVQRLGDLEAGRRSTPERLRQSVVEPTLPQATPGDLSFVLPYRHLADILEFLHRMDELAPGVARPGTLLYGVEVKFYSSRLELDSTLMTQVAGLYAVGDGAGVTRGLAQSSASGIVAARGVLAQLAG
ncbi:MAG: FAD-binding protein [Coriobacteriia bacterium]|nr:FAD-binding protein [Coriobacteriia bacterium]